MKKLFTTLALAGAAFAVHAQKNVDLALTITQPVDNQNFPNLAMSDTFKFVLDIQNLGTDDVVESDTLLFWNLGFAYNMSTSSLTWNSSTFTGGSIPAGETLSLELNVVKGNYSINAEGDTIVNFFFDDAVAEFWFESDPDNKISYYFDVVGWDNTGAYFNDPGITVEDGEIADWAGNNVATVTNVSFGTPSSVNDVKANTTTLAVYPNPANNQINFSYNVAKAGKVSAKVTDITGRVVMTKDFGTVASGEQTFSLSVADLPNGNYALEIVTSENRGVSKFTVTK